MYTLIPKIYAHILYSLLHCTLINRNKFTMNIAYYTVSDVAVYKFDALCPYS